MTPPRTVGWNILFCLLGLLVVLNVFLAIVIAVRLDRVVLVEGSTDVYRSLPLTFADYLLIASFAVTILAFLITILMILFKSFAALLYAFVASLTSAFANALNIGNRIRNRTSRPSIEEGRDASHSGEESA